MVRLNNPKRKEFTQEDFEQYPVWVWDDEMEYKLPILDTKPSRYDYGVYFIKTKFTTDGYHFDGYLIGNKTYYAFGIFINGEEFILNLNMPSRIEIHLKEIFHLLKCEPFSFFPIHYESTVCFKEDGIISGTLILKE